MYNKHSLKNAEFVISKDEYGFREVLDDFGNAQYINILMLRDLIIEYQHKKV